MPIFKIDTHLIYYAHVPKCAGSAVETYVETRFGPMAFQMADYLSVPHEQRWCRTSPQHISVRWRDRLFPPDFFAASFAVVRHPVSRLLSAYYFQRDVERTISLNVPFSDWLAELPELLDESPYIFDNHMRPMNDLVPCDAQVFHLEHGLDPLVGWLDGWAGSDTGPRHVAHVNNRRCKGRDDTAAAVPDETDLDLIARLYATDFDRFGYELDSEQPTGSLPDGATSNAETPTDPGGWGRSAWAVFQSRDADKR